jgi:EAL domain-containing protein (putative c-di-GMP-specific phosphodiesterase class I)
VHDNLSVKPQDLSDPKFTFAFQPIVDTNTREVLSYEALIRGLAGEPAYQVLQQISAERLFAFDQRVPVEAIGLAMRLQLNRHLNLNFLPGSVESSTQAILSTLEGPWVCEWPSMILARDTPGSTCLPTSNRTR